MKLAVVILSYKRPKNIAKVVGSVLKSEYKPNNIYVFNNNPEIDLKVKGATVINSGENFGCRVRHALALVIDATHFLFLDDDLVIETKTIGNFVNYAKKYPDHVLGYFGVRLTKGDYPYTQGKRINYRSIRKKELVDIVLGRIHFCDKEAIETSFFGKTETKEDDIILSLLNWASVIPAIKDGGIIDLPERGVGNWKRPNHWHLRNEACLELDFDDEGEEWQ